jgi:hypothetical protein
MISQSRTIVAAALAVALAGGVAVMMPSLAATAPDPAASQPMHVHHSHIEGRIAFLKAELKITDAQLSAWNALADAMRANSADAESRRQNAMAAHGKPMTAVEHLDMRESMLQNAAAHVARINAAFKPLYASLSDEQKQAADELFAWHHDRHGEHRHH